MKKLLNPKKTEERRVRTHRRIERGAILESRLEQPEQSGEWGVTSKKEHILDKDGQRMNLKNGTFKSRKVDIADWNSQENA